MRSGFRVGGYRPFCAQHVYFDTAQQLNNRTYQLPSMFPTPHHTNIGFYVVGTGSDKPFSVLMTDAIPDLSFWGSGSGQFFPRWTYAKAESDESHWISRLLIRSTSTSTATASSTTSPTASSRSTSVRSATT